MKSIVKSDIDKALGEVFKKYRIKNKLTQEQIAEKLGISVKYISRIENGTGGVKVETLVNYMNILGISPNVIFGKLITTENLQLQMKLSEMVADLSDQQVRFIINMISSLGLLEK